MPDICLFMAHEPSLPSEVAAFAEQRYVREQARRVFGREPESVQFQQTGTSLRGLVCFVRIRFGFGDPIEFIFVNRALLGIPLKR